MPVKDADVGIIEILGSHKPFRAVLKQTVDDFVVNEVLPDGTVAKITNLARLDPRRKKRKEHPIPDRDQNVEPVPPPTDAQYKELDALHDAGCQASDTIKQLLSSGQKSAVLPVCNDKATRTKIHAWVAQQMRGFYTNTLKTDDGQSAVHLVTKPAFRDRKRRRREDGVVAKSDVKPEDVKPEDVKPKDDKAEDVKIEDVKPEDTKVESAKPEHGSKPDCKPAVMEKSDEIAHDEEKSDDKPRDTEMSVVKHGMVAETKAMNNGKEENVNDKQEEDYIPQRVSRSTIVQFLLWKRNRDTTSALFRLSKQLRLPVSAFSYAGTKDKRAVTTQRVQVRGVSEHRFAEANRWLLREARGVRCLAVGNFRALPENHKQSIGLGDLRGNRFTIVLRDVEMDEKDGEENLKVAIDSVRNVGFVNYYGLQRFGSGVSPTHETGFAFFRNDFEEVCRRILLPLKIEEGAEGIREERKRFITALEKFGRREIKAKELFSEIPRRMVIERQVAGSFMDDEDRGVKKYDYRKAFGQLPRNLRKIYGHAVQSYLWNVMASERIRLQKPNGTDGMHAMAGDLVLQNEKEKYDLNFESKVRAVTKEEESKKSVSVYLVVIPMVGSEVGIPDAEYANKAKKIVELEKLDLSKKLGSEYGMKGTYRHLLAKPKHFESEKLWYTDIYQDLVQSGVDELEVNSDRNNVKMDDVKNEGRARKEGEDSKKGERRQALVVSFTLGCAEYATMLFRELTRQDSSTGHQKALQRM